MIKKIIYGEKTVGGLKMYFSEPYIPSRNYSIQLSSYDTVETLEFEINEKNLVLWFKIEKLK
jgi:hypothetical protein